jgi:uroporphyrinogen-III synthase
MQVSPIEKPRKVKSILVTLPKPDSEKSPYFDLAKKYNLKIDFRSFIHVEGVQAKDFRKEKINFAEFTAVIFTSRNAVDHFFRICEEMRYDVPSDMKYFCISESTAFYLQKYVQYRKRKIFYGNQKFSELMEVIKRNKTVRLIIIIIYYCYSVF